MSTSDVFTVRSRFFDYMVDFTGDFGRRMRHYAALESIFIVDRKVFDIHSARLASLLPEGRYILVDAMEENKTIDFCQKLIVELLGMNVRNNYHLVAVGGGIIQDITAFTASILMRGVKWVFFPTTLLAQADSCIGSKTSINLGSYKNIVGGFYPPVEIVSDPLFLESLSENEIRSGIGEILHFYLIADSPMIPRLVEEYEMLLKDRAMLVPHIRASLAIKRTLAESDEFDKKERNIFNYGHTFGHALETITRYGISHGQAVTRGMDVANFISMRLGYIDEVAYNRMHAVLRKNMPAFSMDGRLDEYVAALAKDKKNKGGDLGCILTKGPGAMMKVFVPLDDQLRRHLAAYFSPSELK